ncbi:hypothetical protein MIR68_004528 [Amoeboaphelidium protococcarum]|nr:hypothetical protein MIR68_004528 [Amoeboaphelidium protococcarum]KAI3654812.1 hypothetical protein MP228_000192 [Amoeboaphelidium protococcarum]
MPSTVKTIKLKLADRYRALFFSICYVSVVNAIFFGLGMTSDPDDRFYGYLFLLAIIVVASMYVTGKLHAQGLVLRHISGRDGAWIFVATIMISTITPLILWLIGSNIHNVNTGYNFVGNYTEFINEVQKPSAADDIRRFTILYPAGLPNNMTLRAEQDLAQNGVYWITPIVSDRNNPVIDQTNIAWACDLSTSYFNGVYSQPPSWQSKDNNIMAQRVAPRWMHPDPDYFCMQTFQRSQEYFKSVTGLQEFKEPVFYHVFEYGPYIQSQLNYALMCFLIPIGILLILPLLLIRWNQRVIREAPSKQI